jgi:hypothetical protein
MLRRASDMPPEAREWLESVGERASSPLRYVLGFMFHLSAGAVFATIGGAVGAAFLRRDPSTVTPPPLPPL